LIRSFIALDLPEGVKKKLEKVQQELNQNLYLKIKWEKLENIHLTLIFLGEISSELIKEIKAELNQVAEITSGFSFRVKGISAFPSLVQPRVIWAGVETGRGKVIELQQRVELGLKKLKFSYPRVKEYLPHITLGRVKGKFPREKITPLSHRLKKRREKEIGEVEVKEIVLMKSELSPAGATYTPLAKFSFKKSREKDTSKKQ
jgi:2'-5' RNA ligase